MSTRREFLHDAAGGALAAFSPGHDTVVAGAADVPVAASDVGSLYPFVRSQAVAGEFPLSFLKKEFADLAAWKRQARGKLLDLLHYAPPPCDPRAETVERVDRGDYVQEKVYFNTTPDVRVPAFVLVPKKAPRRAPASRNSSSGARSIPPASPGPGRCSGTTCAPWTISSRVRRSIPAGSDAWGCRWAGCAPPTWPPSTIGSRWRWSSDG